MIKTTKLHYSIVTEVKEITIDLLYEDHQTVQRNVHIITKYGETLDLILYADERNKLELQVPLEVYKGELEE